MQCRFVLFIFVFYLFNPGGFSQVQQSIQVLPTVDRLDVALYRGIIEFKTCKCKSVQIIQSTYDYDSYRQNKTIQFILESVAAELLVYQKDNRIYILNELSRNIQKLIITVPEQLKIKVNVNHYGELTLAQNLGNLDIEIFQGRIQGSVSNAISAAIIRDGDLAIELENNNFGLAHLSVFDGEIALRLPPQINTDFDIQLETGTFTNLTAAVFSKTEKYGGTIKKNGHTMTYNAQHYTGHLNTKSKNYINIKNALGKVTIRH